VTIGGSIVESPKCAKWNSCLDQCEPMGRIFAYEVHGEGPVHVDHPGGRCKEDQ